LKQVEDFLEILPNQSNCWFFREFSHQIVKILEVLDYLKKTSIDSINFVVFNINFTFKCPLDGLVALNGQKLTKNFDDQISNSPFFQSSISNGFFNQLNLLNVNLNNQLIKLIDDRFDYRSILTEIKVGCGMNWNFLIFKNKCYYLEYFVFGFHGTVLVINIWFQ